MQEYFSDALRIPTQKLPSAQVNPDLSQQLKSSLSVPLCVLLFVTVIFIFTVNHNKEVFFCQADPDHL